MAFFEVKNLTRKFGGLVALDDLSFAVEPGMIFSIIGPNGAGKTTIYNCIGGIYAPNSGQISFHGESLIGLKTHDVARRGIARTFQNIELFSYMTTMDNLLLGRHLHMKTGIFGSALLFKWRSFYSKTAREEITHRRKIEEIIDFLDLQSARDKYVGGLPYGTQKLIELGRALALEPKLLLLDEPFAGMNNEERRDLYFQIKDIRDELGITVIMIEHDMQMVMDISDRVLVIDFGKKLTEGSGAEVAQHPDVIKAYLGED